VTSWPCLLLYRWLVPGWRWLDIIRSTCVYVCVHVHIYQFVPPITLAPVHRNRHSSMHINVFGIDVTDLSRRHKSNATRVSKSFRTGRLERELQMIQLSATKCIYIAILWVSLVSFANMTLCVASQRVFIFVSVYFLMTQSGNFWIHLRMSALKTWLRM
jgi:hypothetical protein